MPPRSLSLSPAGRVPLLFITAGACWAGRPEGARPGLGARRRWQDGLWSLEGVLSSRSH